MRLITVFVEEDNRKTLQIVEAILPVVKGQIVFLENREDIEKSGVFVVSYAPEIQIFTDATKVVVPLRRVGSELAESRLVG